MQEGDEIGFVLRGKFQRHHVGVQIFGIVAAAGVMVYDFFEGGKAAVVHVGSSKRDIAQGRYAKSAVLVAVAAHGAASPVGEVFQIRHGIQAVVGKFKGGEKRVGVTMAAFGMRHV